MQSCYKVNLVLPDYIFTGSNGFRKTLLVFQNCVWQVLLPFNFAGCEKWKGIDLFEPFISKGV